MYVDSCIVISDEKGYVRIFITCLTDDPEKFEFTEEASLELNLGVKFVGYDNKTQSKMTQPFLIDHGIAVVGFELRMTDTQLTPAVKPLLHKDKASEPRRTPWNYPSVIGKMNCLQ